MGEESSLGRRDMSSVSHCYKPAQSFQCQLWSGVGSARVKDLALLDAICAFTTLGKPIPRGWAWQRCPEGAAPGWHSRGL